MAGVSLVADAAEELERATNNMNISYDGETYHVISKKVYAKNGEAIARLMLCSKTYCCFDIN